jgi:hypothetical protein
LREGAKVTIFFGSRGINAVRREKAKELTCLPDAPLEVGKTVGDKMGEMGLPLIEDLFVMLIAANLRGEIPGYLRAAGSAPVRELGPWGGLFAFRAATKPS